MDTSKNRLPAAAFETEEPAAAPVPKDAAPAANGGRTLSAAALKAELDTLVKGNLLPEGFDLEAAVQDPKFIRLVLELPAYAAVRVYDAERRAEGADQRATQGLLDRLRARDSLPRPARADNAGAPSRDYLSMSPEEFARVERQFREQARKGIKVKL